MSKASILALLTLGLSASVQAADVTLYGYIDLGLVHASGAALRMERGQNNWLGVRGNEPINADLATTFEVQMRFEPDTGAQEKSTVLFQGETTVGFKSASLGALRLGRALTPLWAQKWVYDPWYDSDLMGSIGNYNGDFDSDGLPSIDFHNYSRVDHAVYYSTPEVAGFSLHAEAEMATAPMATHRATGFSLNYEHGPLSAMFAYEKNHIADRIQYVAGSYQYGRLTMMGSYSQTKVQDTALMIRSQHTAATYALGTGSIRAGYGRIAQLNKHKATLGYVYPLSKRTNLYADIYREQTASTSNGVAVGANYTF